MTKTHYKWDSTLTLSFSPPSLFIAGSDYVILITTVIFSAGETESFIFVTALPDNIAELSEDFTVVLSNPSAGLMVGDADTAEVIITDDDGELLRSCSEH